MAIKGLTDREASFPKIGTLRKGNPQSQKQDREGNLLYKDKDGKQTTVAKGNRPIMIPGRDLDHFRFDSNDKKAIADFKGEYGKTPTEIHVMLPYETTEKVFFTCKEAYTAGGLQHRCDGELCSVLRINGKIQHYFVERPPCPGGCKEIGRLQVIVRALKRFGYITVETHSINDIVNLNNQLKAAEVTFGSLRTVPFVLRRSPDKISTPAEDGGRSRRESWLLSIEVDPVWSEKQLEASHRHQMAIASSGSLFLGATPPPAPVLELPSVIEVESFEEPEPLFTESEQWANFESAMEKVMNSVKVAAPGTHEEAAKLARQTGDRYLSAMRKRIQKGEVPGSVSNLVDAHEQRLNEFLSGYEGAIALTP